MIFSHAAFPDFILKHVAMFKMEMEKNLHRCAWHTTFETHGMQIPLL